MDGLYDDLHQLKRDLGRGKCFQDRLAELIDPLGQQTAELSSMLHRLPSPKQVSLSTTASRNGHMLDARSSKSAREARQGVHSAVHSAAGRGGAIHGARSHVHDGGHGGYGAAKKDPAVLTNKGGMTRAVWLRVNQSPTTP